MLLSRSLRTSCQTKLRRFVLMLTSAGVRHVLSALRATTHCISQECILPRFTTGERKSVMWLWSSKNINGQECNLRSGTQSAPMVKQVQQVLVQNVQGIPRLPRLNAVESCRMHTCACPLKEHANRGRHGRCLPSQSKQFNSMQPPLGWDPRSRRTEWGGWWEILHWAAPAQFLRYHTLPNHSDMSCGDHLWQIYGRRGPCRKWIRLSIGSFREPHQILRGILVVSLSKTASHRSICRWIGTSIKPSYSAHRTQSGACGMMQFEPSDGFLMNWVPNANSSRTGWASMGIHGHPRLLLQGPLDRWRVDPFGQVPQTPGATGASPRTEYGPPALAGESDTRRFVEREPFQTP